MASGIYLITCAANKRRYVGSSNDITYRWRKHREKLASGKHWNRYLQRSWNKYGSEAFEYAILESVEDVSLLHVREQFWIDTLHPEFNLSPYANRPTTEGLTYSEESRKRLSEGNKRHWASLSDEGRKARGAKMSHPHSEETRRFLSERMKLASEETKAKFQAGRIRHAEQRRLAKAERRAEWEIGREDREQQRREKLRIANLGKEVSEETRAKLRAVAEQQQADPDYRARHQQAVSEAMQRPDVKAKHHEGIANRLPMSEVHKANIGKAHKGMKRPEGTGEKIAASKRGKHHSDETRAKLKAAWERRKARKLE